MKVLGITGGVGSGKSQVLQWLKTEYGATIVQLDEVAKRLQQSGEPCFEQIVKCFGADVVGADQELDRAALGRIVFADKEKLQMLNAIVHPAVKRWVEEDIAAKRQEEVLNFGRQGEELLYVIEAALLPGNGYEQVCDEMWYIYAKKPVREERLQASRGYTREQISRMMDSQPDEETFRGACQVVIDNSGTFEETKRQIADVLR